MFFDRLTEIPQTLKSNYETALDGIQLAHPELAIADIKKLDAVEFGYDQKTLMHQLTFDDGTNMNIRFRRFRHPGYLMWDPTFTAEHVLMHTDVAVPPEVVTYIEESLHPGIKAKPHFLQTHVGVTRYGAITVFSSNRIHLDHSNSAECLSDFMAWDIQSVKNVIPAADQGIKKWAETVQRQQGRPPKSSV